MLDNTLPISQARMQLPELVDLAELKKTFITVKGKIKAVLMDPAELARLEATLEILSDPKTRQAIEQGQQDAAKNDLVDWQDLKRDLGI